MTGNKKSWYFLLAIVVLVAAFVSACGSNNSNGGEQEATVNQNDTDTTVAEAEAEAEEEENVKLVVWIWDAAQKALEFNMEAFNKQYPHIQIEFQTIQTADLYQKFLIAANTGDAVPDVVALETSNLAQMVAIDSLLDITERVAPYKDTMNQYKWADAIKDNQIYAMPWDSGPVAMFYNSEIFEKAGLPTDPNEVAAKIQTFEDYFQAAKLIKETTDLSIFSDSKTASNNRMFETMMWQQAQWYVNENGDVSLDSPENIAIGEYLVNMTNSGYVFDAEPWSDSWLNAINSGKVATIIGASWFDGLLPSWISPDGSGKWRVAPMPKWSLSDKYGSANDGGSNLAINKSSKHPEAAWKFIEFMLGNEDSQMSYLNNAGFFPSLETTYSKPDYEAPVEYFGGQPIRAIFIEAVKQVNPQPYTQWFPLANQAMTDTFAQIYLKKTPVDEAFKSTADELRTKIKK